MLKLPARSTSAPFYLISDDINFLNNQISHNSILVSSYMGFIVKIDTFIK